jgi:hypothetical protein
VRRQPPRRRLAIEADLWPQFALVGDRRFEFGYRRTKCRVIA